MEGHTASEESNKENHPVPEVNSKTVADFNETRKNETDERNKENRTNINDSDLKTNSKENASIPTKKDEKRDDNQITEPEKDLKSNEKKPTTVSETKEHTKRDIQGSEDKTVSGTKEHTKRDIQGSEDMTHLKNEAENENGHILNDNKNSTKVMEKSKSTLKEDINSIENKTDLKDNKEKESTRTNETYVGGIDGGATNTHMVIMDSSGKVVSEADTTATNPWVLGFEKSAQMLLDLIEKAKQNASKDIQLEAIGMSLSGAGQEESRKKLKEALASKAADVSKIFIAEDILAPVYTISDKGGINMICGTGSNCVVFNPDGSEKKIGGWGHILGDEASAYWIAYKAIKTIMDERDGFTELNYKSDPMKQLILKYFDIKDLDDILGYIYERFSKDKIAGLAKEIAQLAKSQNDEFAKDIYKQTGYEIGKHILALRKHINDSLIVDGCLTVICTGSVFKSWDLMKDGFVKAIDPKRSLTLVNILEWLAARKKRRSKLKGVKTVKLVRLTDNASIGAAVWAAKQKQLKINQNPNKKRFETIDVIHIGNNA